jgi:hypothetical protein
MNGKDEKSFKGSIDSFLEDLGKALKFIYDNKEQIIDFFERLPIELDRWSLWFYKMGWPPIGSMPPRIAMEMGKACKNKKLSDQRNIVDSFMVEYFTDHHINHILSTWKRRKSLGTRISILEEAIEAHINGRYFVSVPTFLTQIEGVLSDSSWSEKGRSLQDKYLTSLDEILDRSDYYGQEYTKKAIMELFRKKIIHQWFHGDKVPFELNRHAILHGGDVNYGSRKNSLKTILLLNLLVELVE